MSYYALRYKMWNAESPCEVSAAFRVMHWLNFASRYAAAKSRFNG